MNITAAIAQMKRARIVFLLPPMSIASQNNSLPLAFTFTYIYKAAMSEGKEIWKLKIPLKIKIFLWFFQRGILLTKDNLAKKN